MNIIVKRADFMLNKKSRLKSNDSNINETKKSVKTMVDIIENDEIDEKIYLNSEKKLKKRNLTLHELIETKKSILFNQMTTDVFNAASAEPILKLVSKNSHEELLRRKTKFLLRSELKKDISITMNKNKIMNKANIELILPVIKENKYSYLSLSTKEKLKVLNNLIKSGNIIENSNNNLYKENYYMLHKNNNPYIGNKFILSKNLSNRRTKLNNNYKQKQHDNMTLKATSERNYYKINLIKVQFSFYLLLFNT
jgi:hypothetical protein